MGPGNVLFEILDGVRRARAYQLVGIAVIRAQVQHADGSLGPIVEIPISDLRSPFKSTIDVSTAANHARFWQIWGVAQRGQGGSLPPIIVQPGARGARVQDLGWIS